MKINLEKYPAYKPSGVEWIGDVPSHWEVKKFKRVFYEIKKRSNPELSCGSISFGKVVYKDDEKIPESTKKSYQVVLKGDFLVNPLNLNYDLISLRIALSEIDVVVSSGYIVLSNSVKLDKTYYKYFLHRFDVAFMKLLGSGVRQTLNYNDIANCDLISPPLPEQTAIAAFLDRKTALIEQAIGIKQKQIELLKERRQILIHKAVTRGIGSLSGAETPNIKLKDSGVDWIGEIPEGWSICKLKLLIDVKDGTHDTPAYVNAGADTYPLATTKHVTTGVLNLEEASHISTMDYYEIIKRSNVELGDIIMPMIGTIGSPIIVETSEKFAIKNLALFKTANSISLSNRFLFYLLQSELIKIQFELVSNGGVLGFMSLGQLRNLIIPKLSLNEQTSIVEEIDSACLKIATAISLKEQEIEKLKEYKATLINSAVTGKIKVDNDDK